VSQSDTSDNEPVVTSDTVTRVSQGDTSDTVTPVSQGDTSVTG